MIIFGSIISEGWRYDRQQEVEVCIINNSYSTCQLATTVGVLACIIGTGGITSFNAQQINTVNFQSFC